MKKILSIIALLLAMLITFAACDGNTDVTETTGEETTSNVENNNESESPLATDYSAIADKWEQYVEYVADIDSVPTISGDKIFDKTFGANTLRNDSWIVAYKTKVIEEVIYPEEEETDEVETDEETTTEELLPVTVAAEVTYEVYNFNSGELFNTYYSVIPVSAGESFLFPYYTAEDYIQYTVDVYSYDGIIEISKSVLVLKDTYEEESVAEGEEPAGPTLYDYDRVTTYSYYDADGNVIAEDIDRQIQIRSVSNDIIANENFVDHRYLIDTVDNTFLMNADDEILEKFDYMCEYDIPVFDKDNYTLNPDGYAYFEANGYKYVITEATPIYQTIGDLTMYTTPGMSVTIMDEDYNILVEYETDAYHVSGYAVLDNGSVYICEYKLVFGSDAAYDFELADMKFDATHKIVDPTTCTVEDKALDFVAQSLFNGMTKEIKSFTSIGTLTVTDIDDFTSNMDTVKVKDGYVLAQLKKYDANKTLSDDVVYAVLDQSLNIVAELPSFIPSQFGYPYYVNDGALLIPTKTVENTLVNYTVDLASGEVALYIDTNNVLGSLVSAKPIEGGYFFRNKVYDLDWNLVCDFDEEDYEFEVIINGKIYYSYDNLTEDVEIDELFEITEYLVSATVVRLNGEDVESKLEEMLVCSATSVEMFGSYIVCGNTVTEDGESNIVLEYRDLNGNLLLRGNEKRTETVYDPIYGSADYTGRSVVTFVNGADGTERLVYTVTLVREVLNLNSDYTGDISGYDRDRIEELFPDTKTYTTYHIFE